MQITIRSNRRVTSLTLWDVYVNTVLAGTIGNQPAIDAISSNLYDASDGSASPISDEKTKAAAANAIVVNYTNNPPS